MERSSESEEGDRLVYLYITSVLLEEVNQSQTPQNEAHKEHGPSGWNQDRGEPYEGINPAEGQT